jgi:hypothetical protein
MTYPLSLTQSQVMTALRAVLLQALPAIEVIQSEDNQVPEPAGNDFVVMNPLLRTRLAQNYDLYQDASFMGSISGTVLTVASMILGTIQPAASPTLWGTNVTSGTLITAQTGGTTGGAGTYTVSISQSVASAKLACGIIGMRQPTQFTVQMDIHGPNSGDNVEVITTLMRSLYAYNLFVAQGYDVTPLYCGDPRQSPWLNKEQQIERLWSCDVVLQANQIVQAPQQFADQLDATVYPPADA